MPNDYLGVYSAGGAWLGAAALAVVQPVDRPDLAPDQGSESLPLLDLAPGAAATSYFNVSVDVRTCQMQGFRVLQGHTTNKLEEV